MAKIRITEGVLRSLIRESIIDVLNEDGEGAPQAPTAASLDAVQQVYNAAQKEKEQAARVQQATQTAQQKNLNNWNSLKLKQQIMAIQKAVGATPDGVVGPETTGKILAKLNVGNFSYTPKGGQEMTFAPEAFANADWQYGKGANGFITPPTGA